VAFTDHPHLAIPLLPLWAFPACSRENSSHIKSHFGTFEDGKNPPPTPYKNMSVIVFKYGNKTHDTVG
jgi:hypothetical protein